MDYPVFALADVARAIERPAPIVRSWLLKLPDGFSAEGYKPGSGAGNHRLFSHRAIARLAIVERLLGFGVPLETSFAIALGIADLVNAPTRNDLLAVYRLEDGTFHRELVQNAGNSDWWTIVGGLSPAAAGGARGLLILDLTAVITRVLNKLKNAERE